MLIVPDRRSIQAVPDDAIRRFLNMRYSQLLDETRGDDGDDVGGFFLIVEPGDTTETIEAGAGFPVFHGLDDAEAGSDDFSPLWEWVAGHTDLYEVLVIPSDGGDFISVILPRREGVDRQLLDVCATFALPESANLSAIQQI